MEKYSQSRMLPRTGDGTQTEVPIRNHARISVRYKTRQQRRKHEVDWTDGDEITFESSRGRLSRSPEMKFEGSVTAHHLLEPPPAFIRFTWEKGVLTKATGELDRFLPTNLLLQRRWRIQSFLRNDSHADVYSVLDSTPSRSGTDVSREELEAHILLDEYHGNCDTFVKRRKRRWRESGECAASFWYRRRHVFIIRDSKKIRRFALKNMEEEFPSLIRRREISVPCAVRCRQWCGAETYASAVKAMESDNNPEKDSRTPAAENDETPVKKDRQRRAAKQRNKRRAKRNASFGRNNDRLIAGTCDDVIADGSRSKEKNEDNRDALEIYR